MTTQKLSDCCTLYSGGTPTKGIEAYWRGNTPWFSPKDIKSFDLIDSQDHISKLAIENSATRLVDRDTILVVGRSGVLAHTLPVGIVRQPSAFNQDIKAIVPDAAHDPEFIALCLKAKQPHVLKDGVKRGPTVHSLIAEFIENLEIPKLPIEKQRQIATRLKAQLAEVDKARQAAEVQLRDAGLLATRLRENLLNRLDRAPRLELGELLLGIEAGKSFQTTDLPARSDQLGVLKVSAVSWDEFAPDEAKAIEGDYKPEEKHRVKKGDLIISRANTIELVGAVVRVSGDYPCRLLSDKTLRLIVDETQIVPDYLLAILKLPEARTHIENNATGTSDSMRNISQKTIKKIPVPLIDLNDQAEFVRSAQLISEQLKQVNGSIQKQKTELELIPQKILAQAFEM